MDDEAPPIAHAVEAPRATTSTPIVAKGRVRALVVVCAVAAGAMVAFASTPAQHRRAMSAVAAFDDYDRAAELDDVQEPAEDAIMSRPAGAPEELTADGEEPLHVRFPSLSDWVHPVLGAPERLPIRSTREFGADRPGDDRPAECGGGHCGVDLAGPRGTPVVAVAWGTVVRIVTDPDRRSGRYVRLAHPEGAETSYMHLDDIAEDLQRGDEVEAGQVLGTLGMSGINRGPAHLHFSLALPGGTGRTYYIDPVPYLEAAQVIDGERSPAP